MRLSPVTPLLAIVLGGVAMAALALSGSVALLFPERILRRVLLSLVAFAAGSLVGGALFHMIPAALETLPLPVAMRWVAAGFLLFFAVEQFLHWHHCHRESADCKKPLGTLILVGDGLHNLLGGMAIAGVFLVDLRLGVAAWLAAAAHEVPQEIGDFGVLLHAGWSRSRALLLNVLSGLTFLAGGLLTYAASGRLDVRWLVPLAAGNFLYIGASDLVPEVNRSRSPRESVAHFLAFALGLALLALLAAGRGHHHG